jgi:hypothetical protein
MSRSTVQRESSPDLIFSQLEIQILAQCKKNLQIPDRATQIAGFFPCVKLLQFSQDQLFARCADASKSM